VDFESKRQPDSEALYVDTFCSCSVKYVNRSNAHGRSNLTVVFVW
jgi:hypothetical protein